MKNNIFNFNKNSKVITIPTGTTFIPADTFRNFKQLEEIIIPDSVTEIGPYAFEGCIALKKIKLPKKLKVLESYAFSNCYSLEEITIPPSLHYLSKGLFRYCKNLKTINLHKDINYIDDYALYNCRKLTNFTLPKNITSLGIKSLSGCNKIKEINIPKSLTNIEYASLSLMSSLSKITVEEKNSKYISDNDIALIDKEHNILIQYACNSSQKSYNAGCYTTYSKNNTSSNTLIYNIADYAFAGSKKLETLNINSEIESICPKTFLNCHKLKKLKIFFTPTGQTLLFNIHNSKTEKCCIPFEFFEIEDGITTITENISEIFKNAKSISLPSTLEHIGENVFSKSNKLNQLFIPKTIKTIAPNTFHPSIKITIETIIKNNTRSLQKFLNLLNPARIKEKNSNLDIAFSNIPKLVTYCNLLDKYQQYDQFLYNPKFFMHTSIKEQELLIKNYNKNIKRLLINSKVLETNDYEDYNLRDLLKFIYTLGVFSDNKLLSQKTCTFITEKIFLNQIPNETNNPYSITGNDIHKVFNEIYPHREINLEYILFFIENYKELINTEKNIPGFIALVYNNFNEISKCSTKDTGTQRHLKVTIDKCKTFILMQSFDNITKENRDLAEILSKYYYDNDILTTASSIIKEAKRAPRNIFTKITLDKNNNVIYNNDPKNDLKEICDNNYSYEWLPKQSYDNLILGKYCNCCAHINGNGAGIMRASMITDNCQNLIIRDESEKIIAKLTIYVNKERGYAVYNTIEVNQKADNDETLENIYKAFLKGTKTFLDKYNENNPNTPISTITIGQNRNILEDILLKNNHQTIQPYRVIDYSSFKYSIGDSVVGSYVGDATESQILILSKKT